MRRDHKSEKMFLCQAFCSYTLYRLLTIPLLLVFQINQHFPGNDSNTYICFCFCKNVATKWRLGYFGTHPLAIFPFWSPLSWNPKTRTPLNAHINSTQAAHSQFAFFNHPTFSPLSPCSPFFPRGPTGPIGPASPCWTVNVDTSFGDFSKGNERL